MQQIFISGRLGSDAKRNDTNKGDTVANFSVAVDSRQGREKVTNWWRCSIWGKRAEALGPHLTKGMSVAVTGEFSLTEYDGKQQLNCRVSEITLLGGAGEQRRENDSPRGSSQAPGPVDDLDDEIPF